MNTQTIKTLTAETIKDYRGSDKIFRHQIFRNFYYSDGVAHVQSAGEAHWLIDAIASVVLLDASHGGLSHLPFQVWKFQRIPRSDSFAGKLTCYSDDGVQLTQEYEQDFWITDFPLDEIKFLTFLEKCEEVNEGKPFYHLILAQEY